MLNNSLLYNRHGHYCVGDKIFLNKADALIAASSTAANVRWDFNDAVFSSINWSTPIATSLFELYRQRAQQLRDKYDYVSLFFSGGVDSGNALHAFIDNNILLDEIIILRPKVLESTFNTIDKTDSNLFSETEFAALPHLRRYIKDQRTKIRIIHIDDTINWFLSNDSVVSQFHKLNLYMLHGVSRLATYMSDPTWNELYAAGKNVCHIHGVDKPIVKRTDGVYSFNFLDLPVASAIAAIPDYHSSLTEMTSKHQFHELFYWTPDLPQLVIKQCQVVKAINESGILNPYFQNSDHWSQDKFAFMYPWIYPPQVIALRDSFHTMKGGLGIYSDQQQWFYQKMPHYINGVFNDMVMNMQNSVDSRFFRGPNNTNYYLEDPDIGSPKTALRTIKSKEYIL